MEFLTHVLPNGLEIVAECNPEAYSTALGFIVKTGARDESDEIAGVSHFLEHMAFKGTPTRSADDVNRELDEMGSHCNAGTSEETTVFYAPVLPEYQTRATEVLADILRPVAPRGRLPDREESDPRRDPDVRGPAALRGRREVPRGLLRRSPLGPQRAGHDGQHRGPAGRGHARLFPPPLCPGQHRPGGGRPRRFRSHGRRLPAGLRRLGTGRVSPGRRTAAAAKRIPSADAGLGHAAISLADVARLPRRTTTTAMRPRSWRSSWATIPAAGCTGNSSIRASPKWPS